MPSSAPSPAPLSVPPVWAVGAVLLALAPALSLHPFMVDYDAQRLLVVVATVGLAAVVVAAPRARAAWLETWSRIPTWAASTLAAVLGLGLASTALAARPAYAAVEVASLVLISVGAVAVASAGRGGARGGLAFAALLVLGSYAAVVVGWTLADRLAGVPEVWPFRNLGYANVRFYNQVQAWLLPIVWAVAASERSSRALRAGARAVGALSVALLIASYGRGLPLALGVGLAAALAVRGGGRALLREALASVVVGGLVWAVLFDAGSTGMTAVSRPETGTNGRAAMWLGCLRMIAAEPWLGLGPMHFAYYQGSAGAHPHNLLLQLATEWGLPAALLAAALAGGAGAVWIRRARRAAPGTSAVWTAGLTAMAVTATANAMVDSMIMTPTGQLVAVLGLGALLAEGLPEAHVATQAAARRSARLWPAVALAAVALPAAGAVLGVVASDVPRLSRRDYDVRAARVSPAQTPRFWAAGQISGRLPADRDRFWPEP